MREEEKLPKHPDSRTCSREDLGVEMTRERGGEEVRGGGGLEGASLDGRSVRETRGKTKRPPVPQRDKIGKEFRASQRLHVKACGATDAQDKSTHLTVCLRETQIPSASKTNALPWSM